MLISAVLLSTGLASLASLALRLVFRPCAVRPSSIPLSDVGDGWLLPPLLAGRTGSNGDCVKVRADHAASSGVDKAVTGSTGGARRPVSGTGADARRTAMLRCEWIVPK